VVIVDLDRTASVGGFEVDLNSGLEVLAPTFPRAAPGVPGPKEVAKELAENIAKRAPTRPTGKGARLRLAKAVVITALIRVREHGISFVDLLEALFGASSVVRIAVRVIL
jgi:hypothetical protein